MLLAEREVAEQPALLGQPDLRAVGELARLAEVVHERGGDQQVGVQPRVQLARLERERGRPRPCARAARRGRRGGRARARRAPPLRAQRVVAEQALEQRRVAAGRGPRARGARGSRRARRGRGRRRAGTPPGRPPRRARSRAPRPAARRGSAPRARARARGRRARSARRAGRRRGTRAPGSRRCGRAARAPGRAGRSARAAGPCACRRRRRRPRRRGAGAATVGATPDDGRRPDGPSLRWIRMQPLRWERRPDGLRAPALVCAFKGWNDAGEAATSALAFLGARLEATALRDDRPRGVRRLPGDAPAGQLVEGRTREIDWPEFEIYEARVPRAPRDLVLLTGPEPSLPLAHVLRAGRRAGRGARRADGRDPRRAAGRRPALAAGRHHRHRSDEALVERLGLRRRATRARPGSSASCTPPAPPRHAVRVAVGGRAALRRRRAEPEGRAGARAQARGRGRRHRRRLRPRDRRGRLRAPGHAARRARPRGAGVRRAPRAGGRRRGGPPDRTRCPSGDVLAREFQRFLRQRGGGQP